MSQAHDESTLQEGGQASPPEPSEQRATVAFCHREGIALLEFHEPRAATVGRAFPADLVIAEPSLSRAHARFTWSEGVLTVTDLDSSNGTFLAGERVSQARLKSGDELKLGGVLATAYVFANPALAWWSEIDSYERMIARIRAELVRARETRRQLSLLMIRSLARDQVGHFVQGLSEARRKLDSLGMYDDRTLMVLLPELGAEQARAEAQRMLSVGPPHALVAGLAVFPSSAVSEDELIAVARRNCLSATTKQALVSSEAPVEAAKSPSGYVVRDAAMLALYHALNQVARRNMPVLIQGETGVGKEVIAATLHQASQRRGPFRAVNCAAIPLHLTESVLFGHERGAFTGAVQRALGVFEDAEGGTVFLDEIGELGAAAQAALLRVLEERRITRVGATRATEVDVRVVAATHRDLEAMVDTGAFRRDLLYRLNTVALEVPPLRARASEIAPLAQQFLERAADEWGGPRAFSDEVMRALEAHDWPGNVRQLRNVVERAAALCEGAQIEIADLPSNLRKGGKPAGERARPSRPAPTRPDAEESDDGALFKDRVRNFETALIKQALDKSKGNLTRAAELLGMPIRTLTHKLKAYEIKKSDE